MVSKTYLKALLVAAAAVGSVRGQGCSSVAATAQEAGLTQFAEVVASLEGYEPAAPILTAVNAEQPLDTEVTAFAPTSEAFAALQNVTLDDQALVDVIIKNHIVEGALFAENITMMLEQTNPLLVQTLAGDWLAVGTGGDGSVAISVFGSDAPPATVTMPDVETCAGVVHVIDSVLVPAPCDTLLNALAKNPETSELPALFQTLDAETQAQLADPNSAFTLLAPSNDAVAMITESITAGDIDNSAISDVLKMHIIPQALDASSLTDGMTLETLAGEGYSLMVSVSGDMVSFMPEGTQTAANVVEADVPACASGSVVHVIDMVLIPQDVDVDMGMAPMMAEGPAAVPGAAGTRDLAPGNEDNSAFSLAVIPATLFAAVAALLL